MNVAANAMVALVAVLHIYFMILEMFFWTKPKGLKIFSQTLSQAQASKVLAQNQGLYNGFLAAGLFWGLLEPSDHARAVKFFFLGCVIAAGLLGAFTVNRKIFFAQALPAILAVILVFLS